MRFKTGLCIKLSLGIALLLFSVIYLKDNEILSHEEGDQSHIEIPKVQAKNVSKLPQSEVAENKGPAAEQVDLAAEPSDSLAGNRIDGLPNITEPRSDFWN